MPYEYDNLVWQNRYFNLTINKQILILAKFSQVGSSIFLIGKTDINIKCHNNYFNLILSFIDIYLLSDLSFFLFSFLNLPIVLAKTSYYHAIHSYYSRIIESRKKGHNHITRICQHNLLSFGLAYIRCKSFQIIFTCSSNLK